MLIWLFIDNKKVRTLVNRKAIEKSHEPPKESHQKIEPIDAFQEIDIYNKYYVHDKDKPPQAISSRNSQEVKNI